MIDKTFQEELALETTLRALGEIAGEIGFSKPLANYTKKEALMLIEVVVTAYQDHLLENCLLENLATPYLLDQKPTEGVPFDV